MESPADPRNLSKVDDLEFIFGDAQLHSSLMV